MMRVFGRLPFAYGEDGALKEHGSERHDVVDLPRSTRTPEL